MLGCKGNLFFHVYIQWKDTKRNHSATHLQLPFSALSYVWKDISYILLSSPIPNVLSSDNQIIRLILWQDSKKLVNFYQIIYQISEKSTLPLKPQHVKFYENLLYRCVNVMDSLLWQFIINYLVSQSKHNVKKHITKEITITVWHEMLLSCNYWFNLCQPKSIPSCCTYMLILLF